MATMTRNHFVKTISAGTFLALPGILKAQQAPSANVAGANSKLNIAGIGIGGMGAGNLNAIASKGHTILALCDVDPNYARKTREKYPQAKFYVDYREMLAQEKSLDGVMIATPDHTHAVIAAAAIKAGKRSEPKDLEALIWRVLSGEIKYCPHGRPVATELTKSSLDKNFKRT